MSKRSFRDMRKAILSALSKSPLTYAELERKLATNADTLRLHCEDMEIFGAVRITKKGKHKTNGRPYFVVSITDFGRKVLKKF